MGPTLMLPRLSCAIAAGFLLMAPAYSSAAEMNAVEAGEFVVEPPTLINLGFEWRVNGDDNRNAKVDVSYRKLGTSAWKSAMPLMRMNGERIYQEPGVFDVVMPNGFAGSILDLEPNTTYEARFVLSDPDTASRTTTRSVTVKTRAEPIPAAGGRVFHVYPPDWKGPREPGSFDHLMCAYNYYCGGGDTVTAARPRVKPGDVILVHAGTYRNRRDLYTGDRALSATTPVEGTYYLTADGTEDKPIVIKAAGDGEVIFDGDGNFNLFNVKAADYNYFEGITFRNSTIAIWAGTQFIAGSKGLTVKRSKFEDVNLGIFTNWSGSSNFYIADNVFLGRDDPNHLEGWNGDFWRARAAENGKTFPPLLESYTAVRLYGPGHVVAYNYIANWHDGVDIETYGNPDGSSAVDGPKYPPREYWDRRPVAIDFYNNLMTNFHDNAFEIDGGMHNIRVMRNLMLNSASHPFCNQPAIGGPVYWIRNIAFNAPFGSTRLTNGAAGVMFLNNTILTETAAGSSANVHWMNNLMMAQNGLPAVLSVTSFSNSSSSDYNGFKVNAESEYAFEWNVPAPGMAQDYSDLLASGKTPRPPSTLIRKRWKTLVDYKRESGHDAHSISVDYNMFEKVPQLNAKDLKNVQRVYKPAELDFRLKRGAEAINRGMVIPNVTDGFIGAAPDLGALEYGKAPPHYGPRP